VIHHCRFGIRLTKLRLKEKIYIFANSDNLIGKLILIKRGYRIHHTLFGRVFKKPLVI